MKTGRKGQNKVGNVSEWNELVLEGPGICSISPCCIASGLVMK